MIYPVKSIIQIRILKRVVVKKKLFTLALKRENLDRIKSKTENMKICWIQKLPAIDEVITDITSPPAQNAFPLACINVKKKIFAYVHNL